MQRIQSTAERLQSTAGAILNDANQLLPSLARSVLAIAPCVAALALHRHFAGGNARAAPIRTRVRVAMAEVLLVDDDGSVLLTLAIALRRRGHAVTVAGDAAQALSHLQRRRFAFVVSDVRMPGMSGVELAALVRRMPDAPRVILTSAFPSVENTQGAAEAFLQKPLDIEILAAILDAGDGNFAAPKTSPPPANHSRDEARETLPRSPLRRDNWQPASG